MSNLLLWELLPIPVMTAQECQKLSEKVQEITGNSLFFGWGKWKFFQQNLLFNQTLDNAYTLTTVRIVCTREQIEQIMNFMLSPDIQRKTVISYIVSGEVIVSEEGD